MKTINFKELEWIVLEEKDNTTKLLLKNVLDAERIKKYSTDDWYINCCYVAHTDNVRPPFDWDKSYIKNTILENFKKDLGIECDITLLTREEVEALDSEIRECNDWYWTRSNASSENDRYSYAWLVSYDGDLGYRNASGSRGVRPVIILNSKILVGGGEAVEGKLVLSNKPTIIEPLDITTNNVGVICLKDERGVYCGMNKHSRVIANKLNEIIKVINERKD